VFGGVGVALVSLFDDDSEIDAKATAEHAARLVDAGMRAVVVAGTTGEASALDSHERGALLDAVRAAVAGAVPVVAGVGAPSTRQALELVRAAREHGADALLALSPPRVADPLPYYRALAGAAGGTPLLAYHFPDASPPGIPLGSLGELPVQGVKDSSGDPDRLLAELDSYGGSVYVGSASMLALAGPLGCAGAILALANAEPEACAAAFGGDVAAQRRLITSHLAARRDFPHGLKALVAKRYGTSTSARLG
jgi:dihydrodipicolinate synthase/N-acetylneuraminate lyase